MSTKKVFSILLMFLLITILAGCGSVNQSVPTSGSGGGGGGTTGAVTLRWVAPTTNADGTPLTDLGGFKVYYGTASRSYTHVIDTGNVTSYSINSLSPGTYYFAVTSYDLSGIESAYSNELSKTIP